MELTEIQSKLDETKIQLDQISAQLKIIGQRCYELAKYRILNEIEEETYETYRDFFDQIKSIRNDVDIPDEQVNDYKYTLEIRFKNGSFFGFKSRRQNDIIYNVIRVNKNIITYDGQFHTLPIKFINDLGFDNECLDALNFLINKCINEYDYIDIPVIFTCLKN